jgi:hypothetical protein
MPCNCKEKGCIFRNEAGRKATQRFTGVDPLADRFAHVSPFNYAENEPIGHIDLWGLQQVPYPVAGLLRRLENLFSPALKELDNIKPNKEAQNRIDLVSRGLGKMGFGIAGTVSGAYMTGQTFGAAAPIGATVMVASLTETNIGLVQVIDGLFGEAEKESIIHVSGSGPGLVAYKSNFAHAELVDAAGEVLPSFLSAGWKGAIGIDDLIKAIGNFNNGKYGSGMVKGVQAIGAGSSFIDLVNEIPPSVQPSTNIRLAKKEIKGLGFNSQGFFLCIPPHVSPPNFRPPALSPISEAPGRCCPGEIFHLIS